MKMSRFPAIFVNHGGGPMPLMGRQPEIAEHMKEMVSKHVPQQPKAIVMFSAHWESTNKHIKISSSPNPQMYFDYGGFPPETYKYDYPASGDPELARQIQTLLKDAGISSELDEERGFDHGVFVPLMIMYPKADIPVVCVSLDRSLDPTKNMAIGAALGPLRNDQILFVGSGLTYHNMQAFFNPSQKKYKQSREFNSWLIDVMTKSSGQKELESQLARWASAPGARESHPREEHLLPLFMVAATNRGDAASRGGACPENDEDDRKPKLVFNTIGQADNFAITAFVF